MFALHIFLIILNLGAFFWFFYDMALKPWRGKTLEAMMFVAILVNLAGALNGIAGLT